MNVLKGGVLQDYCCECINYPAHINTAVKLNSCLGLFTPTAAI